MAVRIRLKKMGRRHRPFFRVCAMDSRAPVNGRVLEELGTYDPMVPDTDARAILKHDRVQYWLGVGALPTEKVAVLIKKYGPAGTHMNKQQAALERIAHSKVRVAPVVARPQAETEEPAEAEAPAESAEAAPAEAAETAPEQPTE